MEQKKTYRTFQFGNVVWKSAFRGTLSASGHPNVEIGTPRYSRELLTCGVPKTVDWSVERLLMLTVSLSDATATIGSGGVRKLCPRHARAP